MTALMIAAGLERQEITEMLVAANANFDKRNM